MSAAPLIALRRQDMLIGAAVPDVPSTLLPPIARSAFPPANGPARRSRIWEFNPNLHCSIVGTCLSTGELRQVLGKLGLVPAGATDHELHGRAVSLVARHDQAARLLNKALDQRHRLAINQFGKARTEGEVRDLWRQAVARGDIPGAYWATLTHPATSFALVREAFGDVHMLSHLVGAANRADIRRLRELEARQAELEARLARQQAAFHDAVVTRDARIHALQAALVERITSAPLQEAPPGDDRVPALRQLLAALEKRLATETRRRIGSEGRHARLRAAFDHERGIRHLVERENAEVTAELAAIEADLALLSDEDATGKQRLDGVMLLYVGGRPGQIGQLRAIGARFGATFLHHDGGKEQHPDLLPGLVSRADIVLFPVDCVSHDAALTVKRCCRQAVKRFVPLRAASLAAFVAALSQMKPAGSQANTAGSP